MVDLREGEEAGPVSILGFIGGILSFIGKALPVFLAYLAGLKTRDRQNAEARLKRTDAQATIAANRPESLAELAERLRREAGGKP